MYKSNDMGNNITINTINNHITMHVGSPKFTHMYTCVQRSLYARNVIYNLPRNQYVLVEIPVCWIPPQKWELYVVNVEILLSEHSMILCSLLTSHPVFTANHSLPWKLWGYKLHMNFKWTLRSKFWRERQDLNACGNTINLLICYSQNGNWVQAKGQKRHFIFAVKGGEEKNVFEE